MAIEFRCSQCNQLLRVSDASAGKNARCPKCQALMTVPAAGAAMPAAVSPPPFPGTATLPPFPTAGSPFGKSGPVPEPAAPPPAFAPAAPPQPDDPFAFLKQDAGPPPPQPAANPFGDQQSAGPFGGPAASSTNPYAPPSAYGAPPPTKNAAGQRIGLPWENKRQTLGSWFETMGLIIGSPTRAFAIMRQRGGLGTPMLYNIYGIGIPLGVMAIIFVPIGLIILVLVASQDAGAAGVFAGIMLAYVLVLVVSVLLAVTVGALIGAAILHLLLMVCGGANRSYETTFRVLSYANGALAPLHLVANFLPLIGPLGLMVWQIVLLILGLAQAHETSTGKTAIAVLLPIGLCMALYAGLMFVVVLSPIFLR